MSQDTNGPIQLSQKTWNLIEYQMVVLPRVMVALNGAEAEMIDVLGQVDNIEKDVSFLPPQTDAAALELEAIQKLISESRRRIDESAREIPSLRQLILSRRT